MAEITCRMCYSANADSGTLDQYYCIDCNTLIRTAVAALVRARTDGCNIQGYDPSSWREAKHRLDHASTHIYMYRRLDTSEDHLAHAICDLVMEYARRKP